jgi:hypothetical protein
MPGNRPRENLLERSTGPLSPSRPRAPVHARSRPRALPSTRAPFMHGLDADGLEEARSPSGAEADRILDGSSPRRLRGVASCGEASLRGVSRSTTERAPPPTAVERHVRAVHEGATHDYRRQQRDVRLVRHLSARSAVRGPSLPKATPRRQARTTRNAAREVPARGETAPRARTREWRKPCCTTEPIRCGANAPRASSATGAPSR